MASRKYKKHRRKERIKVQEKKRPAANNIKQIPLSAKELSHSASWKVILPVLILTFAVFFPVLNHEFIFWDDPEYTTENPFIKQINIGALFGSFYFGNYHPLTLLTYAIEYHFVGFNPALYHFDNLLLHLINTLLVFVFVSRLTQDGGRLIPVVTALLFAIHPMHVESVSWISERKDVLYSAFFLGSLICYLKYLLDVKRKKYLLYSGMLFIMSLFSKAQAVPLPLLLLLLDWYKGRRLNWKVWMEKLPFFALSLLFGILAVKAQQTQAAINVGYYADLTSVLWGCYGLVIYLFKSLIPIHLSGVYPYPLGPERTMPHYIYFFPLIVFGMALAIWKFRRSSRELLFGSLFFLFIISVVLKFIPVGDAILAERYTYMPYVGIFYVFAIGYKRLITERKNRITRKILLGIGAICIFVLALYSYNRTKIWHDTRSFWSDVIEKQPHYWQGYSNLAHAFFEDGNYEEAVNLYTKATEMDPNCPPVPWLWRGMIYTDYLPDYDKAISDFQKVMSFPNKADQSYVDASINLGLAYYRKKDLKHALEAHNQAVSRYPDNARARFLRGLVLKAMHKDTEAIQDFNAAISIQPDYYQAFLNRGVIYTDRLAQYDKAISDFQTVLRINPSYGDAQLNIGLAYYKKGDLTRAIDTYTQFLNAHSNNGRAYFLRALALAASSKYKAALKDAAKAQQSGFSTDQRLIEQWRNKAG